MFLFSMLIGLSALPAANAAPTEQAAANDPTEVKKAMFATATAMDEEVGKARLVLLGLTSVKSDWAQYRKPEALRETLRKVKDSVLTVNALLPAATSTAENFEAQFPPAKIKELWPRDGDIDMYIFALKDRIEVWSKARVGWAKQVNDDCAADLEQARTMLADASTKDAAMGHMEMWVIGYHGEMLEAVDLLLPDPAGDDDARVALSPAELTEKKRSKTLMKEVAAVAAKVAAIKAAIAEAHRKRIAAARFPSTPDPGDPVVRSALAAEFGTPLRLGVHADWMTREEARWKNGTWIVGTFRYLGVWIAAKTPSGKTYVYLTQLRSQQRGGTWEPAYYWGVSDSFEMLPENLSND